MTASALFQAPHISLISLTRDDSTRAPSVARRRRQPVDSVLSRVAQGDPIAQRECVDQFGNLVWSIARQLTHSRADAEDAVREIFTEVWRSADRFDPAQGSESVFVVTIARRRLVDRMRRAARPNPAKSQKTQSPGWGGNSVGSCTEARDAAWAVTQLRPELQRVLELGLLRGLNHAEIAEVLQLPVATVKTMMHRGLIQVRELMGGNGGA